MHGSLVVSFVDYLLHLTEYWAWSSQYKVLCRQKPMAPCRLIRNLLDIVIIGDLLGRQRLPYKGQTVGRLRSATNCGFDQKSYVGRFVKDIENLTIEEERLFTPVLSRSRKIQVVKGKISVWEEPSENFFCLDADYLKPHGCLPNSSYFLYILPRGFSCLVLSVSWLIDRSKVTIHQWSYIIWFG